MEYALTQDQQTFFDLVINTRKNYLLTGPPGTGKSVLARAFKEYAEKNSFTFHFAAPTGLAALNIGGHAKTLHRLFRLPVSEGIIEPDFNKWSANMDVINNVRYNIRTLFIDEISMVRADMFDFLDRFMRFCKQKQEPFGGVQIICIGDFYQLPPVTKWQDSAKLKEHGWASPFIFSSRVFQSCFETYELTEVLRQKGDPKFIKILTHARTGDITATDLKMLNKQVRKCTDVRIRLAGTNPQAQEINEAFLRSIDSPAKTYTAAKWGEWPADPCELNLNLKVGAQVMVKKNGADRHPDHEGKFESSIVNGTLGVVTEMGEEESGSEKIPFVKIVTKEGVSATIYQQTFQLKAKTKRNDKWEEVVVAEFTQVPLVLAWAMSIHKSQGQTFDTVHIDAEKIFSAGQLYVAISRSRTLAGITFEAPLTADKFYANKHVQKFYEQIPV